MGEDSKKTEFCIDIKVKINENSVKYYIEHEYLGNLDLDYGNYLYHIREKHKEMDMYLIFDILDDPDFIYRSSKNGKRLKCVEKTINGNLYRVIVYKVGKEKQKTIKTAYKVMNKEKFTAKNNYCLYDREYDQKRKAKEEKQREEDLEYFKEIFNVM